MKISVSDLKDYRHINRIILAWQKNVDELNELANKELTDKVVGSNPDYPYNEQSFKVRGVDNSPATSKYAVKLSQAKAQLAYYKEVKATVEQMREEITDLKDKLIFEYTIKGTPQSVIADLLAISQPSVSIRLVKMLNKYGN